MIPKRVRRRIAERFLAGSGMSTILSLFWTSLRREHRLRGGTGEPSSWEVLPLAYECIREMCEMRRER